MFRKIKLLSVWFAALPVTAFAGLALMGGLFVATAPATVLAAHVPVGCPGAEEAGPPAPGVVCPDTTEPRFVKNDCEADPLTAENCGIIKYLLLFINGLSALVGIVIVMMITIGGIQYSTAGDNPQATVEAKKRITNAILALVLYIFTFSFLQYIVPGGIF